MTNKNLESVVSENKTPESSNKTEIQPANPPEQILPIIKPSEPDLESWSYMGTDSTAVTEISFVDAEENEDEKALTTWMGSIKKPKKGQKMPDKEMIQRGIELARVISADANRLINIANRDFAGHSIFIGRVCLELKKLIRNQDELWGAWAEKNLPFISKRNREKFMMLAKRPDCWPFSFLGVDRQELLCAVTRNSKEKDPIGKLFQDYNIPYDEDSELNMGEFKALIDAATNNERLKSKGLTINFNLVANVINIGMEFDKGLIKRLKDIHESGGDPEIFVKKLIATEGKEKVDDDNERKLQDFDTLSTRLIQTINYLLKSSDQLEQVSKDIFLDLIKKLAALKEAANLTEEDAA